MAVGTTLIPASRFGEVLRRARVGRGLSLDDLAAASAGRFTAGWLEQVEFGEFGVDDDQVERLAGLYDVEVCTLTPQRAQLVIDLEAGTVTAGPETSVVGGSEPDPDDVLTHYLSLVYTLRGIEPGTPIPLRDLDVATLSSALDRPAVEIERDLHRRMTARVPDLTRSTNALRRRLVIPAAGVLVAATAVGALVFLSSATDDTPSPPPVPVEAPGSSADADVLFTPVPVEPGKTSVEVPPLVLERDDPTDPAGEPRVVEAAPLGP
jgi:hypothetical protein